MAKAEKNIFGQYLPYVSPTHTEEELQALEVVVNGFADQYEAALTPAEFLHDTKNINVVLQHIVGKVNENLPTGIDRVDGLSIKNIVQKVINERSDAINALMVA